MKKKAIRKSKARPASPQAARAKAGPAAKGKAKPPPKKRSKPAPAPKVARAGGSKLKTQAAAKAKAVTAKPSGPKNPAPAKRPAKSASKVNAKAGPKPIVEPKPKPKPKSKAHARRMAPAKAKAAQAASTPDLLRKVAPRLREDAGRDTEVILAPELISKTLPEVVPAEDEGALRNVMSSLTALFGGRDDLTDAELDALLDSKMASGEIPPSAALDPLDEAQSLVYEAWNSDGSQRVRLARKALEICPDCADAYVILAEHDARDKEQALALFRQGVEAGERALGPEVFRGSAGRFWEVMEARPYMRARLGLAECLWEQGGREEALGHLRELLRLNPADNQGVRKILARCEFESGGKAG